LKIWDADREEPTQWQYAHVLRSKVALRTGSLGLIAHHVDASFGDITVTRSA